jgi:recombination protein RecT
MTTAVTEFRVDQLVYELEPAFKSVSVDKGITFAREAEFAIQILCASEYALKMAQQNPQSVRDAVTNVAAIGVSLNPAKKQAYLVPRKGGITLVISYMGLLDLAIQSGSILWGQAEQVFASDKFTMNGFDQPPTHERNPFATDRGALVGCYVVVKTRDGDYLTTTMTAPEVFAIRDRSDAYKISKSGPWVTDEGEMVKKTVIKRAAKTWPRSDRVDAAVHHLNENADEGITFDPEDPLDKPHNMGLSPARYKIVRGVARAMLQHFNEGDEPGAYGEWCAIEENEEKEVIWGILKPHSALRSAIKAMREAESAAEEKLKLERSGVAA